MEIKKKISVVIPVYNEQENILELYKQLTSLFLPLTHQYEYELIWVDDGSHDSSWQKLAVLATSDPCLKVFKFSRNFGHQAALSCGYEMASGDAVVSLDADLQDPPAVILSMIKKWQAGADIVYARRINRKDSMLKKVTAWLYYRLLDAISDVKIPRNVGDFRLLDKKVVHVLRQLPEKARYLRGMVAWTGFKAAYVDFNRQARVAGTTGYSWKKMFKFGLDGLTSFSSLLIKLPLYVGIFMVSSGCLMGIYFLATKNFAASLWLAEFFYMMFGVQSLLLWGLGEYVGRIAEQQKARPLFIVDEHINQSAGVQSRLGLGACHNHSHKIAGAMLLRQKNNSHSAKHG